MLWVADAIAWCWPHPNPNPNTFNLRIGLCGGKHDES